MNISNYTFNITDDNITYSKSNKFEYKFDTNYTAPDNWFELQNFNFIITKQFTNNEKGLFILEEKI